MTFRVMLTLLLLASAPLELFAAEPLKVTISKETTYITEPLDEDGLPDYRRAWLQRLRKGKVKAADNGAVEYWQVVGLEGVEEKYRQAFCDELGMPLPPNWGRLETTNSPDVSRELAIWYLQQKGVEVDEETFDAYEQNNPDVAFDALYWPSNIKAINAMLAFPASEVPPLKNWLARNFASLDLIVAALDKPGWYDPPPSLCMEDQQDPTTMGLRILIDMRGVADSLAMRAQISLGADKLDSAVNDLVALQRLSRKHPPETCVDLLVAQSMRSLKAAPVELQCLTHPQVTDEILQRLQSHHALVAPASQLPAILTGGERLFGLQYSLALLRKDAEVVENLRFLAMLAEEEKEGVDLVEKILQLPLDADHYLKEENREFDAMVAAFSKNSTGKVLAELKKQQSELGHLPSIDTLEKLTPTQRADALRHALAALDWNSTEIVVIGEAQHFTHHQLMHLALALGRYRLKHQEYPDRLDSLVPTIVEQIPADAFGNSQLGYRKTEKGFLLYSYGLNGQDDGGSHNDRNILQGYSVGTYDQQIRELLGDESPGKGILRGYIPVQSDDVAIRVPLVEVPLPGAATE